MSKATIHSFEEIRGYLGDEADSLLNHQCKTLSKDYFNLPGKDVIEKVFIPSDRNVRTLQSLASIYNNGRLGGTGYLSILPVDQGIEHTGGSAFAPNPEYFDPENIIRLAINGDCNAVATTFGGLEPVCPAICAPHSFHCKNESQ